MCAMLPRAPPPASTARVRAQCTTVCMCKHNRACMECGASPAAMQAPITLTTGAHSLLEPRCIHARVGSDARTCTCAPRTTCVKLRV
jgi:hypothetical protein